ncbi:MAG: hypothetical protein AAGB31_08145 [Bdellovibrio sp.]
MILMWLGSWVLMMYGLTFSQAQFAEMMARLQKDFWNKGLESSFGKMLVRALDVVILEASPQKSLYAGLALRNLRVLSLRPSVLVMSLSTLGSWWAIVLGLLFLSFNGFFLLGICALGFVTGGRLPQFKKFLQWLFGTGVFLIGGEAMLRHASVVQTFLGQSEWAFWLADGRMGAVLGILVIGLIASLVIKVEFWSLTLALSLLVTNTLSFNGALGLVAGERLGRMVLLWWHSRSLNQECRRLGQWGALSSALGVLIGFFLVGELRSLLYFDFSSDRAAFQDKTLHFMLLFTVMLGCQLVAQMIWGHFASQSPAEEVQEDRYFPESWLHHDFLSPVVKGWGREKVLKRLSEIRYHLQGLHTLKEGQIPEALQARLRQEEQSLSRVQELLGNEKL